MNKKKRFYSQQTIHSEFHQPVPAKKIS
jgi:hypothetical protein